jgi:hypothetical protein
MQRTGQQRRFAPLLGQPLMQDVRHIQTMTISDWLRLVAIVLIGIGTLCLPVGLGVNPRRDPSMFFNLADLGFFLKIGATLLGCGIACLIASAITGGKRGSTFDADV